jgi:hypothetical protein
MIYTAHRINTLTELETIPTDYGVEIDLRDQGGVIILHHVPFSTGISFENFLQHYHHQFLILNIKSERIEFKVNTILPRYKITNYFFLDSSFPMIHTLSNGGENNIAIRYSEYESFESVLLMSGKVHWVWVDCFHTFPLNTNKFNLLKEHGFKICIVSPELQNQPQKIETYGHYMLQQYIQPDMICTKIYNIPTWQKMFS